MDLSRNNKLLLFIILIFIINHIITLPLSPMPWFDEVIFQSISLDFLRNGSFKASVSPSFYNGQNMFIYGPVYFFLQSFIFDLFGISVVTGRFLNLSFSFGIIVLVIFFYKKIESNSKHILLFVSIFTFDYIFNRNMHSGRMDLIPVFIAILAHFIYFNLIRIKQPILRVSLLAILLSLSILTTPRICFAYIFLILDTFYLIIKDRKKFLLNLIIGSIVTSIYCLWIFYSYGSFTGLINEYNFQQPPEIVKNHTWFSAIFRYFYENPLVILVLIILFWSIYKINYLKKDVNKFRLLLFTIITIISFHAFIREAGPYMAMVIPFYFLFIGIITSYNFPSLFVKFGYVVLALNITFFSLKNFEIYSNYKSRNPKLAQDFIEKNIPKESKVLGSWEYFYLCEGNGYPFQSLGNGVSSEGVQHQIKNFKFDYLFLNKRSFSDFRKISEKVELTLIDSLYFKPDKSYIVSYVERMQGFSIQTSYEGYLYKVNYKNTHKH
jgi:hypothetical protein